MQNQSLSPSPSSSVKTRSKDCERQKTFIKLFPMVQIGLAIPLTIFGIIVFALIQSSLLFRPGVDFRVTKGKSPTRLGGPRHYDYDGDRAGRRKRWDTSERTIYSGKKSIGGAQIILMTIDGVKLEGNIFVDDTYIDDRFPGNIKKIAEYNGVSSFMIIAVGAMGIITWSSPFPKKSAVKAHFIILSVSLAVLVTQINFSTFHLVTLSKIPVAVKLAYEDEESNTPKVTTPPCDPDYFDVDECPPVAPDAVNPLSREYGILVAMVFFQWLIIFIWFVQILVHFLLAAMICLNFEDIVGAQSEGNFTECEVSSSPPTTENSATY